MVGESSNTAIAFKKRSLKGNIRKREDDDVDNRVKEDESVEEIDKSRLQTVSEQQSERKRKYGIDPTTTERKVTVSSSMKILKPVESMIEAQFSKTIDNGVQINHNPHEKIMEAFIVEKLGIIKPNNT